MRKARGWTQTDLAYHAGLAPSVISQIENGKRDPSASTLRKLAKAFGVGVADLFPKAQAPLPDFEEGWRGEDERRTELVRMLDDALRNVDLARAEEFAAAMQEAFMANDSGAQLEAFTAQVMSGSAAKKPSRIKAKAGRKIPKVAVKSARGKNARSPEPRA